MLSKDKKTLAHMEKIDLTADPSSRIDLAGRPVRGNKDAKVTIINYDDFQCPFCSACTKRCQKELLGIYGDKVRSFTRTIRCTAIHPWADHAAVDANCLNQQAIPRTGILPTTCTAIRARSVERGALWTADGGVGSVGDRAGQEEQSGCGKVAKPASRHR